MLLFGKPSQEHYDFAVHVHYKSCLRKERDENILVWGHLPVMYVGDRDGRIWRSGASSATNGVEASLDFMRLCLQNNDNNEVFYFYFFIFWSLQAGLLYVAMAALVSRCRLGWPWTHSNLPASAFLSSAHPANNKVFFSFVFKPDLRFFKFKLTQSKT